ASIPARPRQRDLVGLTLHGVRHTPESLTGQFGNRMGPSSQAKAGAGANRPRRALRALTARVPQKPSIEAAATPSHGAAKRVAAPAATPTPHATIRRPRNRRSSRQPERAADFPAAALSARSAPAPLQAGAATLSPDLTAPQARRNRPFGRSGGSVGTSAVLPGASRVRAAASRSAFVRASAMTAWRVSLTAWLTAWRTADSTAHATAPLSASAKPSKIESRRSNWLANVRRTWLFVVVVVM